MEKITNQLSTVTFNHHSTNATNIIRIKVSKVLNLNYAFLNIIFINNLIVFKIDLIKKTNKYINIPNLVELKYYNVYVLNIFI